MNVLVVFAAEQGGTADIAHRIRDGLTDAGHAVDVRTVVDAGDPSGYDAVVVGSAMRSGHWREEATAFVWDHRHALAARPVWLFSCGRRSAPGRLADIADAARPESHRAFVGDLAREWDDVDQWATEMLARLRRLSARPPSDAARPELRSVRTPMDTGSRRSKPGPTW